MYTYSVNGGLVVEDGRDNRPTNFFYFELKDIRRKVPKVYSNTSVSIWFNESPLIGLSLLFGHVLFDPHVSKIVGSYVIRFFVLLL